MRIWVGGMVQESNTFSPLISGMDDFRRYKLAIGNEILQMNYEHELVGFIDTLSNENVEITATIAANAVSSGIFMESAWEELLQLFSSSLDSAGEADGAYFALHGAMVAEGCDDACGAFIEEVRKRIGPEKPIVVSLDLHANVTRKVVEGVQGIVGYRTYPHIDFCETGRRSATLLLSILRREVSPVIAFRKIPMIVPAENSQSSHGPFADLWAEANSGELRGDSLVTSLFPVQPWLDLSDMGCSVVVVGEDTATVSREADRLADLFWNKRHQFGIQLHSVRDVVTKALNRVAADTPFIISDSADSPGAGSTGDSNYVLSELLALGVEYQLSCLLTMVDASAVAQAIEAGVGSTVELEVGYTVNLSRENGAPIRIKGIVRRIGDGKFQFSGGYQKGTTANMGRCVVVQIGRISLLLGEWPTFSGDPAMYRTMGLEPLEADLVLVKSANQFRADYECLSTDIFILDTPGTSPADVRRLPFQKLRRPFFPFDEEFDWRNSY